MKFHPGEPTYDLQNDPDAGISRKRNILIAMVHDLHIQTNMFRPLQTSLAREVGGDRREFRFACPFHMFLSIDEK